MVHTLLKVFVHAHCTEGVTRSKGREETSGNGNRVGGGNEDGNNSILVR